MTYQMRFSPFVRRNDLEMAPLRSETSCGSQHPLRALVRHSRLAGRCPNSSSLFLPLAAVVAVAACGPLQTHFHEKAPEGKCIFNIRCHCPLRPHSVKKSFRKIRRFSGSSNIKNKISTEYAQSETEGIQIVKLPETGKISGNSSPARPTKSGDPGPAASLRSAAADGAHPLQPRAAS